jgi:hypothetical protein
MRIAYLEAADNISGPLPFRLRRLNQPLIRTRNAFSTSRRPQLACICAPLSRLRPRSSRVTVTQTVCGCGHGGTRNINTSRRLQT